jgi:hypothetical protein
MGSPQPQESTAAGGYAGAFAGSGSKERRHFDGSGVTGEGHTIY